MKKEVTVKKTCKTCGIRSSYVWKEGHGTKCIWCTRGYGGKTKTIKPRNYAGGRPVKE